MTETPFSADNANGVAVRLLHAATKEMLTVRVSESDFASKTFPSWASGEDDERNGMVTVGADDDRHLRTTLGAAFTKDRVAVRVVIEGLYEVDENSSALTEGDRMYDRLPDYYRQALAQLALDELYPYLREAVQRASSIVYPIQPILLQPPGGSVRIPPPE
ncbi:hypothetical protein [Rhodococcoides fascians]|uniref:hypothetical protein n=1 Tax=Rhodococcoides fascians TaxID=1828 RepID=UPI001D8BA88D|nr:hypothetical protein [Rhodococcus fascians]CAH0302244.1 hypothetical protein SRABI91_04588 [Rhodococcus fascians]